MVWLGYIDVDRIELLHHHQRRALVGIHQGASYRRRPVRPEIGDNTRV